MRMSFSEGDLAAVSRRSDDYLRGGGIPIDVSIIEDLLADATRVHEGTD
jgi:hypothetical protein